MTASGIIARSRSIIWLEVTNSFGNGMHGQEYDKSRVCATQQRWKVKNCLAVYITIWITRITDAISKMHQAQKFSSRDAVLTLSLHDRLPFSLAWLSTLPTVLRKGVITLNSICIFRFLGVDMESRCCWRVDQYWKRPSLPRCKKKIKHSSKTWFHLSPNEKGIIHVS